MKKTVLVVFLVSILGFSQTDTRVYDIVNAVSAERIKKDITTLANFGTRHILSDGNLRISSESVPPTEPKEHRSKCFYGGEMNSEKKYKIHWKDTTSPTWDNYRYVGNVLQHTWEGIVIDNYFFGVAAVGENGHESPVVFPSGIFR